MDGYIKLHRQILESSVFASQIGLKIWVWCLLKANYKDKFITIKIGRGESTITVKRGSFIFGRYKAEDELNIDGSTIYKWIKKLEDEKMVSIESNSHYSVVTICNYEYYQQYEDEEVTTIEQPCNNQVATIEQPCNTTNKEKNNNKNNNIEERKKKFYNAVALFKDNYTKEMLREFYDYWTEHGDGDKKMRFEKEKTFGIERRLNTWKKNEENYGVKTGIQNKEQSQQGHVFSF